MPISPPDERGVLYSRDLWSIDCRSKAIIRRGIVKYGLGLLISELHQETLFLSKGENASIRWSGSGGGYRTRTHFRFVFSGDLPTIRLPQFHLNSSWTPCQSWYGFHLSLFWTRSRVGTSFGTYYLLLLDKFL